MSLRLRQLQQRFLKQVQAGRPLSDEAWIRGATPSERTARIHVYRASYEGRTRSLLEEYFPACARSLGRAKFARLAREFGAKRPASSPLLSAWGREFAAFLRSARQPKWVVELARLEWELERALSKPLPKRARASATKPLLLAPGAEVKAWNAQALSRFLKRRVTHPASLWLRQARRIQVWPLSPAAQGVLRSLARPRSIVEVSRLCTKQGMTPKEVKRFFAAAVARGWVINFQ